MRTRSRVVYALTSILFLLGTASAAAEPAPLASGQLVIQGNRLTLYVDELTTDADQTINVGERARVRTCFGGPGVPCGSLLPGDPRIAGLIVRAELRGPELPDAVPLETVPGGTFFLPSFQQEGDYRLENIRLTNAATGQVLGAAEPSLAVLHVREIVLATATVEALSLSDLEARGISLSAENFQAFNFAVGFALEGEIVEIEFPVLYIGDGVAEPLAGAKVKLDDLPEHVRRIVERWQPPQIVPFRLDPDPDPPRELMTRVAEVQEELDFPLFGAIVIPGTVTYLNQFFEARLIVANGAPGSSSVNLENLHGAIRLPGGNVLRLAQTDPPVAAGQPVPLVQAGGGRILQPGEQGTAAWTVEGLQAGTHTLSMDITGDLVRPGRDPFPVLSRTQAAVEVVDARFNLSFSHPDVVREGEAYSLFVTVTNLSLATQNLITVAIEGQHMTGAHPADPADDLRRAIETLEPGEGVTVEYPLISDLDGKVVAATFESDSAAGQGTILLRAGVGELGIPLSPATLLLPRFTERLKPPYVASSELVRSHVRLLGLGYSLAVAPAGRIPQGVPRVIKTDVERRAVDLAEAGQRTFLGEALLESLEVLALDQLGNRHHLAEFDELRRLTTKGLRAAAQLAAQIREEQGLRGLSALELFDHFGETTSYARPWLAAMVLGDGAATAPVLEIRRPTALGPGVLAHPAQDEDAAVRSLPYGEVYAVREKASGTATVPFALVGHVEPAEVFEIVLTNGSGATEAAAGRLVLMVPDAAGGYRRVDLGTVSVPAAGAVAVQAGAGADSFQLYDPATGAALGGSPNVTAVPLPPFRLVGAVQDFRMAEEGPDRYGNMIRPNRYGNGFSYLFNRPPDVAAAETPESYRVLSTFDGLDTEANPASGEAEKVATGAWVQTNSERVVNVRYSTPISALLDVDGTPLLTHVHQLVTSALVDQRGNPLSGPVPPPALETLPRHLGGLVAGHVKRGTGEGVPDARVQLIRPRYVETPIGTKTFSDLLGEVTTDAEGGFYFDFVENPSWDRQVSRYYTLRATIPPGPDPELEPGAVEEISSVIRLQNRLARINIALLGRGSVTGHLVYLETQEPVEEGKVTAASTLFSELKSIDVNPDGSFLLPGVPVGPITLTGRDKAGRAVYATVGIASPGDVVDVRLEIQRLGEDPGLGTVQGRVLRLRAGESEPVPAPGARIAVYSNGGPIDERETDELGRFVFADVPAGQVSLQAADFHVSRTPVFTDLVLADGETREIDLVIPEGSTRTVTGTVKLDDPVAGGRVPVAGAVVMIEGPGNFAYTDETGRYRIEGVPVQGVGEPVYRVRAIDFERQLEASVFLAAILDVSDEVIAAPGIVLEAGGIPEGGVDGVVLDPLGRPLAGAEVLLFPFAEITSGGDGSFSFDDVPAGKYTLTAHVGDGLRQGQVGYFGQQSTSILFAGHRPFVTIRMLGSGLVRVKAHVGETTGTELPLYYRPIYYSEAAKDVVPRGSFLETSTDPNGEKQLELPVGAFEVVAFHPFFGPREAAGTIEYAGQVRQVELFFQELATVTGQVSNVDGATPVPDVEVTLATSKLLPQKQTTDAQGRFRFELVPEGNLTLTARGLAGTVERVGRTISTVQAGQIVDLEVHMKAQGSVAGQVLESLNGKLEPISHAQFYVKEDTFPFRRLPEDGSWLLAGQDGRYQLSGVVAGRVTVVARDPSQVSRMGQASAEITVDWQVAALPDIVMETSVGSLEVLIRDPASGGPVADAQVRLSNGEVTVTDSAGLVLFDALPLATYSIYAFDAPTGRSGRQSGVQLVSPGQQARTEIYLDQRGEVRGTLYDDATDDTAVKGGTVELRGTTAGGRMTALATTSGAPETEGQFAFLGIPEGTFQLTAAVPDSPRRAQEKADLTATSLTPTVDLHLEEAGDVYVRLYEKLKAGIRPVEVANGLMSVTLSQGTAYEFTQIVAVDGLYRFPGALLARGGALSAQEMAGEQRSIWILLGDFQPVPRNGIDGAGTQDDPFQLVLKPKGTVHVTVLEDGLAVAEATVLLTVNWSTGHGGLATGDDGTVTFHAIPAGRIEATAISPVTGFRGGDLEFLTFDDEVIFLLIHLESAVAARGVVYQPLPDDRLGDGTTPLVPLEGAVVRLRDAKNQEHQAFTAADGSYRFEVLPKGSYTVEATNGNGDQLARGSGELVDLGGADNEITPLVLDASPPRIVSLVPSPGAANVSRSAPVEIVFSEPLLAGVLPTGPNPPFFHLVDEAGNLPPGSWTHFLDGEGRQVTRFEHEVPLESLTLYTLTIDGGPGGVRDRLDRPLTESGNVGSNFTTSDTEGPAVIATLPDLDARVDPQVPLRFDFNEEVVADAEGLDGDFLGDAAELYGEAGDGSWVRLPVTLSLTRQGFSLQVEPLPGVGVDGDTLRRRVRLSGDPEHPLVDARGNPMPAYERIYRLYDANPPAISVPFPAAAPGGNLAQGASYELVPLLEAADDVTEENPGGDVARVDYYFADPRDPVNPQTPSFSAVAHPFAFPFIGAYSGDGVTPRDFPVWVGAVDTSTNESELVLVEMRVLPNSDPTFAEVAAEALAPVAGTFYAGSQIRALVAGLDDVDGSRLTVSVELRRDGEAVPVAVAPGRLVERPAGGWGSLAPEPFDFEIPLALPEAAPLYFRARAIDSQGAAAELESDRFPVADDAEPPVVDQLRATDADGGEPAVFRIGERLRIELRARDAETAVLGVEVTFDQVFPSPVVADLVDAASGLYRTPLLSVPAEAFDGRTEVVASVAATDYGDTTGTATLQVEVAPVADFIAPTATWQTPWQDAPWPAAHASPTATGATELLLRARVEDLRGDASGGTVSGQVASVLFRGPVKDAAGDFVIAPEWSAGEIVAGTEGPGAAVYQVLWRVPDGVPAGAELPFEVRAVDSGNQATVEAVAMTSVPARRVYETGTGLAVGRGDAMLVGDENGPVFVLDGTVLSLEPQDDGTVRELPSLYLYAGGADGTGQLEIQASVLTAPEVTSHASSVLYHPLELAVRDELAVGAGCRVDMDERGLLGATPDDSVALPGETASLILAGGSHGGRGWYGSPQGGWEPEKERIEPGSVYDSLRDPRLPGGGGGYAGVAGGNGGGVVRLLADGAVVRLAGDVVARGGSGIHRQIIDSSGGGAGGAIHVVAGRLLGGGSIDASGGLGDGERWAGGGGGGRIALRYRELDPGFDLDAQVTAHGALNEPVESTFLRRGGAGTIYVEELDPATGEATGIGRLVVENPAGRVPATTPLPALGDGTVFAVDAAAAAVTLDTARVRGDLVGDRLVLEDDAGETLGLYRIAGQKSVADPAAPEGTRVRLTVDAAEADLAAVAALLAGGAEVRFHGRTRLASLELRGAAYLLLDDDLELGAAGDPEPALNDPASLTVLGGEAFFLLRGEGPEIAVTATPPAGSDVRLGSTVELSWTVTDPFGILATGDDWTFGEPSSQQYTTLPLEVTSGDEPLVLAIPAQTAPGPAVYTLDATSDLGREARVELVWNVVDNAPPTGTLAMAGGGPAVVSLGGVASVAVHAEDLEGLASVNLLATGPVSDPNRFAELSGTSDDVVFDFAVDPGAEGGAEIRIDAFVTDLAGAEVWLDPLAVTILGDQPPTATLRLADGTPPAVLPGATARAVVEADDDVGLAEITLHATGPVRPAAQSQGVSGRSFAASFDLTVERTALATDTIVLTAEVTDAFGNPAVVTESVTLGVLADTEPPSVTVTGVAPSYTVGDTLHAAVETADNVGVERLDVTFDGESSSFTEPAALLDYAAEIDRTLTAIRTATLEVVATDFAGNASDPVSITVTLHPDPPPELVLTRIAPATQVLPGTVIEVEADATDSLGLASMSFTLSGAASDRSVRLLEGTAASELYRATLPTDLAAGAQVVLEVEAVDTLGQSVSRTVTFTALADPAGPEVEIELIPEAGPYRSGDLVTVWARARDQVEVASLDLTVDGTTVSGTSFVTYDWTVPAVAAATDFAVTAQAFDRAGAPGFASRTVTVEPAANGGVPTVRFDCPGDGAYLPSGYLLPVSLTASDDAGVTRVELYRDGVLVHESVAAAAPEVAVAAAVDLPVVTAEQVVSLRAVAYDADSQSSDAVVDVHVVAAVDLDPVGANDWTALAGEVAVLRGGELTLTEPAVLGGLIVLEGASITHPASTPEAPQALELTVGGPVYVACGAAIDVTGRGYGVGQTYPGAELPGPVGGGSHLGLGGVEPGTSFGSVYRPRENGGGGQWPNFGRPGGGVIRLSAASLVVDGGLAADGASATGGSHRGGAGGSVYLTVAGEIAGAGSIRAAGGDANSFQSSGVGSGGGGGVAIEYQAAAHGILDRARAHGGHATIRGGPGSVYLLGPGAVYGDLIVDDGEGTGLAAVRPAFHLPALGSGVAGIQSGGTWLDVGYAVPPYFAGHWVEIYDGTTGALEGSWRIEDVSGTTVALAPGAGGAPAGQTPDVAFGDKWQGVYLFDDVTLRGTLSLPESDPIRVAGTLDVAGEVEMREAFAKDLRLRAGSLLVPLPPADPSLPEALTIELGGDLLMEDGAVIDASSLGYPSLTTYPGESPTVDRGGGSHMAAGGAADGWGPSGSTYGSVYRPLEAGGGGGNYKNRDGRGGGVVRIVAGDVILAGTSSIFANGGANLYGGGAGGAVWITARGAIDGSGSIQAYGNGNPYGGGGGGAIGLEYGTTLSAALRAQLNARGGFCCNDKSVGGAGTVYLDGPGAVYGDLVINNHTVPQDSTTELPALGNGLALGGGLAGELVTDRATPIPPYFVGHWVEIRDGATGVPRGTWRIAAVDGTRATLEPSSGGPVTVVPGDLWQGVYLFDNLTILDDPTLQGRPRLTSADPIRVARGHEIVGDVAADEILGDDLVLRAGARLVLPGGGPVPEGLRIELTGDLVLEEGARIDVTGRGYPATATYPGEAPAGYLEGGNHMGRGAVGLPDDPQYVPGSTYGSVYRPREMGAGGSANGHPGGGVVRIVADNVTFGAGSGIHATGEEAELHKQAGAGGSVWITARGAIQGPGEITARGAGSNNSRGGGGGAIAVEYATTLSEAIRDQLSTRGSAGFSGKVGGAGTSYVAGPESVFGDLIVRSLGVANTWPTVLPALGSGLALPASFGAELWTDRETPIPPYFVGHWVEVRNGETNDPRGVWRIAAVDGTRAFLEADVGETVTVLPGDRWQGIYRFDNVTVADDGAQAGPLTLLSADPIRVTGHQEILGDVETNPIHAGGLTLLSGGHLGLPPAEDPENPETLHIELTGDLALEADATIDVTGRGYPADATYPGERASGLNAGGSHMGRGGYFPNAPNELSGSSFGSVYRPLESGGGGEGGTSGRPGGGAVRIVARNVGLGAASAIRANGGQDRFFERSGAGGSIWITASGAVAGAGVLEARGGDANFNATAGGGGGGAIALEYGTVLAATIRSELSAIGGSFNGDRQGGAGTVYLAGPQSTYGDLTVRTDLIGGFPTELPALGGGKALDETFGASLVTDLGVPIPPYFVGHWVEVRHGSTSALRGVWRIAAVDGTTAVLAPNAGETVAVQPGDFWQGVYLFDNLALLGDVPFLSDDPVRVSGHQEIQGDVELRQIHAGDLTLLPGTRITLPPGDPAVPGRLHVELTGDLVLEDGATIDVTGRGYPADATYPGERASGLNAGGSHMGQGGYFPNLDPNELPGSSFGSVYGPLEGGGGGEGGTSGRPGGGAVRIVATNVELGAASAILANGPFADLHERAGAGGSIWITASGSIAGVGTLEARGGDANPNAATGGGGGGAIALEYATLAETIRGQLSAIGGTFTGNRAGGAGTLLLAGPLSTYGDLFVDNQFNNGEFTELPALGGGTAEPASGGDRLVADHNVQPYFVGHWVEVSAVGGTVKGVARIATVDGAVLTLVPEGAAFPIEAGDTWRGFYRFDSLSVTGAAQLLSLDPIEENGVWLETARGESAPPNRAAPQWDPAAVTLSVGLPGSYRVDVAPEALADADGIAWVRLTDGTSWLQEPFSADGGATFLWPGQPGDRLRLVAADGHEVLRLGEAIRLPALPGDGWRGPRFVLGDGERPRHAAAGESWLALADHTLRVFDRRGGDVLTEVRPRATAGRVVGLAAIDRYLIAARARRIDVIDLERLGEPGFRKAVRGRRTDEVLALAAGDGEAVVLLRSHRAGGTRELRLARLPLGGPLAELALTAVPIPSGAAGELFSAAAEIYAAFALHVVPEDGSVHVVASAAFDAPDVIFSFAGTAVSARAVDEGWRILRRWERGLVLARGAKARLMTFSESAGWSETTAFDLGAEILAASGRDDRLAFALRGEVLLFDVADPAAPRLAGRLVGSAQRDVTLLEGMLLYSPGFQATPMIFDAMNLPLLPDAAGFVPVMDARGEEVR